MEFVIDKPWKFNEKHTIALNIIQTMDLNSLPDAMKAFEQQLTKSIGFIDSGPISLHIFIPKTGFIFDEIIPVQVYLLKIFFFKDLFDLCQTFHQKSILI